MTACGQSQCPIYSIRHMFNSRPVNKKCVCVSGWIKGSVADSAEVQCHTGSPSGMFLIPGMGCWASLAELLLPVTCQCVLGTAHHRTAVSCGSFPAFSVFLSHPATPGWQPVAFAGSITALLCLCLLGDILYMMLYLKRPTCTYDFVF